MKKALRMAEILLILIFTFCFSVFASECDVALKGSNVKVSGTGEPDTLVSFLMHKASGDKLADASYLFQLKSDENGKFEFDFYMKDFKSEGETNDIWTGSYTYTISNAGNYRSYQFDYLSYIERNKLIKDINSAENSDIFKGRNNQNIKRLGAMGANTSDFEKASDDVKEKVAELIIKNKPYREFDEDAIMEAFFDAYSVTMLNSAENGEKIAELLLKNEENGIILSEEFKKNSDVSDYTGTYIFKKLPYESLESLNSDIEKAEILFKTVNSDKITMSEIIKANAEKLGIDKTDYYKKYISSENISVGVNERIILSLSKTPVDNMEDFLTLFKTIVENYTTVPVPGLIPGNGGGGGGGGTGAGSAGGRTSSSAVSTPVLESNLKFSDVSEDMWAYSYIKSLTERGIINGFSDGTFRTEENVTREQFLKMLLVALDIPVSKEWCGFADVSESEWYYEYICSAVKNSIVSGISKSEFGIGRSITREDSCVIMSRAMKNLGITLNNGDNTNDFNDDSNISEYAYDAVYEMNRAGIISGHSDGSFEPAGNLTRAQAAKLIYGIMVRR